MIHAQHYVLERVTESCDSLNHITIGFGPLLYPFRAVDERFLGFFSGVDILRFPVRTGNFVPACASYSPSFTVHECDMSFNAVQLYIIAHVSEL